MAGVMLPALSSVLQPLLRSVFDPPMRGGGGDPLLKAILKLFANGEQGGLWDFTNPHGLFQDAGGTLPVASYGDPIGMATDLSGNGNHLLQMTVPARPTYTVDGALHDGVDDFLMAANAEDWTFLHDASGAHMAASSEYREGGGESNSYIGTQSTSGASLGAAMGLQSSGLSRTYSRVSNGVSVAPGLSNPATGTFPLGVPGVEEFEIGETGTRAWLNGVMYRDAPFGAWEPSTEPPSFPLQTVTLVTGTSALRRRLIAISRTLTESERASVNAWLMEGVE